MASSQKELKKRNRRTWGACRSLPLVKSILSVNIICSATLEFKKKVIEAVTLQLLAAQLPGGLGAGRPTAGRPAPRDLRANIFAKVFAQKPLPPRSGATRCRTPGSGADGVYSCKFRKQKYIFVKNENIKYKNKKPRLIGLFAWLTADGPGPLR